MNSAVSNRITSAVEALMKPSVLEALENNSLTSEIFKEQSQALKNMEGVGQFLFTPATTQIEGVSELANNISNVTKNLGKTIDTVGK